MSSILTTHVGSLPRSKELSEYLFAKDRGEKFNQSNFDEVLKYNIDRVVKKQIDVGIDLVSDGEMSKISYATYIKDRIDGFSGESERRAPADLDDFPEYKEKFSGLISTKEISNNRIFILKPKTFVNLSGDSLEQVIRYYKISTKDIIVIHDDLDLELAKIRVKRDGGHGGHNGIKSIISKIGNEFTRIKIGIKNTQRVFDTKDYVLGKFNKNEQEEINFSLDKLINNFDYIVNREFLNLTNNINI